MTRPQETPAPRPEGVSGRRSGRQTGKARLKLAALSFVAALLAFDVALSVTLSDGAFGSRAIPPFGPVTSERQRGWLQHQHVMLARAERVARGEEPEQVEERTFDAELGWTRVHPRTMELGPDGRLVHNGAPHTRPPRVYAPMPPEGVTRIACFGDSFTYGAEVRNHECWAHYLQEGRTGTEVLNFGVGGFGTDQALLRYRREGRGIGARAVLLGILLENIGRNVNRYRPLWYPASGTCVSKPRFVLEAGGGLTVLPNPFPTRRGLVEAVESGAVLAQIAEGEYWARRPHLGALRYSGLARMLGGFAAYTERDVARLWRRTNDEPYAVTMAILEQFHREARADGAEFAGVLFFPREDDLERLAAGDRFWQAGLDRLDRAEVPWLDLGDALLASGRRAPDSGADEADFGYLYKGGHLSPEGNRVAAAAIEAWLRERTGWALR